MANILKDNVQTYVRELIEKEFGSNKIKEKDQLNNRQFHTDEPGDGKQRPIFNASYGKE